MLQHLSCWNGNNDSSFHRTRAVAPLEHFFLYYQILKRRMAVPVYLEPVSGSQIPADRDYNRDNFRILAFWAEATTKMPLKFWPFWPLSPKCKQGRLAAASGIISSFSGSAAPNR